MLCAVKIAERAAEKYDIQIGLYARAVADIWRLPVKEAYLYFFDGAHLVSRKLCWTSCSFFGILRNEWKNR